MWNNTSCEETNTFNILTDSRCYMFSMLTCLLAKNTLLRVKMKKHQSAIESLSGKKNTISLILNRNDRIKVTLAGILVSISTSLNIAETYCFLVSSPSKCYNKSEVRFFTFFFTIFSTSNKFEPTF